MNAVVFSQVDEVECRKVERPIIIDPTDVIVKVDIAGLCGSDLHVYHGREVGLDAGTVMGHEFVGRVVEIGASVRELTVGTLVASPFTSCCGGCFYCERGLTCRCVRGQLFGWIQNGKGLHGCQAEFVRVPLADATLVVIPPLVNPDLALLAGDILSTAFYCAMQGGVGAHSGSDIVAVIGCGPVGLLAILAALELGAGTVFAVDSVPERLALAARFGAQPVSVSDAVETIRRATEGRGADICLEAVGAPASLSLAFELLRPCGTLSSVGVHTAQVFPFSPVQGYDKNLTCKSPFPLTYPFRVGRRPTWLLV
jgi:threonine dehydrogenase-like Zn-dependent dehydrogenase